MKGLKGFAADSGVDGTIGSGVAGATIAVVLVSAWAYFSAKGNHP